MKNLTLTLNATDIAQAVKADSYITGQIDKSADPVKNAQLAYNEQAGDEQYHETKIYRTMRASLAKLEAAIAEYVETSNAGASITDTLSSGLGSFTITITTGDRTSGAFATTLAYLSQEYIINTMLYYWWQPIKPALAKDYVTFASDNILDIKRCLAKSAPSTSSSYSDISGEVTPIDDGGGPDSGDDTPSGGDDTPSGDDGTLVQTVSCNHDASIDGLGSLPNCYGQKAFRLDCYVDYGQTYSLEYSGNDTEFYYLLCTVDYQDDLNYDPAHSATGTLAQIANLLTQGEGYAVLVWLNNTSAQSNTIKVYRHSNS